MERTKLIAEVGPFFKVRPSNTLLSFFRKPNWKKNVAYSELVPKIPKSESPDDKKINEIQEHIDLAMSSVDFT